MSIAKLRESYDQSAIYDEECIFALPGKASDQLKFSHFQNPQIGQN